jgi:outer membrane receptor protein involved in Fe transport
MEDWITLSNSGSTVANAPVAEISGVEVEAAHSLGLPSLSGALAYTYTRAIGNSLTNSTYVPLRLTPRHLVNYRAWWRPGGNFELLNTLQYGSKQFYGNGEQGLDLPPYALWNARLSKRVLSMDIYFAVDNILERRYALTFDGDPVTWATSRNPQPGRTFRVGATITFQD